MRDGSLGEADLGRQLGRRARALRQEEDDARADGVGQRPQLLGPADDQDVVGLVVVA
jgi:hypothetical protein